MKTQVKDVMTSPVITVRETTGFKDLAALLYARDIAAVPVLDAAGRVRGMVCNANLMGKQVTPLSVGPPALLVLSGAARRDRRRREATTAAELICDCPVMSISADAPVACAARALRDHRIRRLLVATPRSGGPAARLTGLPIGIVTRSDLLRAYTRPDPELCEEIMAEVLPQVSGIRQNACHVRVRQGVVTLCGHVPQRSAVPRMTAAIAAVPGVVQVVDQVTFDLDDRYPIPPIYW